MSRLQVPNFGQPQPQPIVQMAVVDPHLIALIAGQQANYTPQEAVERAVEIVARSVAAVQSGYLLRTLQYISQNPESNGEG